MKNTQDLDEVIKMLPEEANDEILRRSDNRPTIHNSGAGIDILVM